MAFESERNAFLADLRRQRRGMTPAPTARSSSGGPSDEDLLEEGRREAQERLDAQRKQQEAQQKERDAADKARADQLKRERNNALEASYRKAGRPMYTDADGLIQPVDDDAIWQQKQQAKAAKEQAAADEKTARANAAAQAKADAQVRQERSIGIDQGQAAVAETAQWYDAQVDTVRLEIDREEQAASTLKQQLQAMDDGSAAWSDAKHADLSAAYAKQQEKINGLKARSIEAQAQRQEWQKHERSMSGQLRRADIETPTITAPPITAPTAPPPANPAPAAIKTQPLAKAGTTVTAAPVQKSLVADRPKIRHDLITTRIAAAQATGNADKAALLTLRRDDPKAWQREIQRRLAIMSLDQYQAYLEGESADLQARRAEIEGMDEGVAARQAELEQPILDLRQRNEKAMASGFRPGDGVTLKKEDGTTETFATESLANQYLTAVDAYNAAQPEIQAQAERVAVAAHEHGLELTAFQAAQKTFQGRAQADTQARYRQAERDTGIPGLAARMEKLDQQRADRIAGIRAQNPDPEGPVAKAAIAAIEKDIDSQRDGIFREAKATQEHKQANTKAASNAYRVYVDNIASIDGLVNMLSDVEEKDRMVNEQSGIAWNNAVAELARTTGQTERKAAVALLDAEAADFSRRRGREDLDTARVLSDGEIVLDPAIWGDEKALKKAIAGAETSEEAKAKARDMIPDYRLSYAEQMLPVLMATPDVTLADFLPGTSNVTLAGRLQGQRQQTRLSAIPRFADWIQKNKRAGSPQDALEYMDEMKLRPGWKKVLDALDRSLVAGNARVAEQGVGTAAIAFGRVPGIGQPLSQAAGEIGKFAGSLTATQAMEGTAGTLGFDVLNQSAQMAPGVGALIAGGMAGLPMKGIAALAGTQTAGSQFAGLYTELTEGQGLSHEEAWNRAARSAAIAGLTTAMLTYAGGRSGVEKLAQRPEAMKKLAKKAVDGWIQKTGKAAGAVTIDALAEIAEELPDELASQLLEAYGRDPKADLDAVVAQFVQDSPALIASIGLMGAGGAAREVAGAFRDPAQPPALPSQPPTTVDAASAPTPEPTPPGPPPAGSPAPSESSTPSTSSAQPTSEVPNATESVATPPANRVQQIANELMSRGLTLEQAVIAAENVVNQMGEVGEDYTDQMMDPGFDAAMSAQGWTRGSGKKFTLVDEDRWNAARGDALPMGEPAPRNDKPRTQNPEPQTPLPEQKAAAEAEIENFNDPARTPEANELTRNRAKAIVRIAKGDTLTDLTEDQRMAVGYRTGDNGKLETGHFAKTENGLEWKKGPDPKGGGYVYQSAFSDGQPQLVIRQKAIDQFRELFPNAAAQIQLSEQERLAQLNPTAKIAPITPKDERGALTSDDLPDFTADVAIDGDAIGQITQSQMWKTSVKLAKREGQAKGIATAEIDRVLKTVGTLIERVYGRHFDEVWLGSAKGETGGIMLVPLGKDREGRVTRFALAIDPVNFALHGALTVEGQTAMIHEELVHAVLSRLVPKPDQLRIARELHASNPRLFAKAYRSYFAIGITDGTMPHTLPKELDDDLAFWAFQETSRMLLQGRLIGGTTENIEISPGIRKDIIYYLKQVLDWLRREIRRVPPDLADEWHSYMANAEIALRRLMAGEVGRVSDLPPPLPPSGIDTRTETAEIEDELGDAADAALDAEEREAPAPKRPTGGRTIPTLLRKLPDASEVDGLDNLLLTLARDPLSVPPSGKRGGEWDWLGKGKDSPLSFYWRTLLTRTSKTAQAGDLLNRMEELKGMGYFPNIALADLAPEDMAQAIADNLDLYERARRGESVGAEGATEAYYAVQEQQRIAFERATAEGPIAIEAGQLQPGDVLVVKDDEGQPHNVRIRTINERPITPEEADAELANGNPYVYTDLTPDGTETHRVIDSITLENGATFGLQNVDPNEVLKVDGRRAEGTTVSSAAKRPLRIDEHGKDIIWEQGDYLIAVDSVESPSYFSLWHKGRKIGSLTTRSLPVRQFRDYVGIGSVEIEKNHRGQGLGTQLYKALLDYLPPGKRGIVSYLPDRANKRQVPSIYRRMGSRIVDGDYAVIEKRADALASPAKRGDQTPSLFGATGEDAFIGTQDQPGLLEGRPQAPAPQAAPTNDLTLESYTPEQLEEEARRQQQRETIGQRQSQPLVGTQGDIGQMDMMGGGDLFSQSPAPTDETPTERPRPGAIEDFGQKIGGARKDVWGRFKDAWKQELPDDPADITLSKYLPEPDYEAAMANGVPESSLATMKAIRDSIPPKPQKGYKRARWGEIVRAMRDTMQRLLEGDETAAASIIEAASKLRLGGDIANRIRLYRDLGYPAFTKAKDYSIETGSFTIWNGKRYDQPLSVTFARHKGRYLTELSVEKGDREGWSAVVDMIRDRIAQESAPGAKPTTPKIEFSLYQDRRTGDYFVGKKAVNGVVRLKTGFTEAKAARAWMEDHQAELEEQWNGLKATPDYRRQVNEPRQGPSRREADVTPEMFHEAFGFRGVEFGNWVENDRRQVDLNEAYDAFMDLAEALGIPPKAVSLDGSLGLAFGARGRPGAKAHYEPDFIVINLTKKTGPGSLAHEWFHGFDNYFARLDKTGETTARPLDRFATSWSRPPVNMRPEVWEAFKEIRRVLDTGPFAERSRKLDDAKTKAYYGTTIEKAARAFERYVVDRLSGREISNDFLVNLTKDHSPALPTQEEMDNDGIRAAYDRLFETLDTRETPQGIALFAPAKRRSPATVTDPTTGFYSQLARVIEDKMPNRATPKQIEGIVVDAKSTQPKNGIKLEELKWTGLLPWLRAQKEASPIAGRGSLTDSLPNSGSLAFQSAPPEGRLSGKPEATSNSEVTLTRQEVLDFLHNEARIKLHEVTLANEGSWKVFATDQSRHTFPTRAEAEEFLELEREWARTESVFINFDADAGTASLTDYGNNDLAIFERDEEGDWYDVTYGDKYKGSEASSDEEMESILEELRQKSIREWEDIISDEPELIEDGDDVVKYAQYQLPGGENYREVVLAMPITQGDPTRFAVVDDNGKTLNVFTTGSQAQDFIDRNAAFFTASIKPIGNQKETDAFRSSHFRNVPNYVAHMRLNERTDAEGQPGLFIEELQSDRHQAGREKGYKGDVDTDSLNAAKSEYEALALKNINGQLSLAEKDRLLELRPMVSGQGRPTEGIPDAPHRKDWPLALFKRALRDAVASGKDWIGWTPGQVHTDRWGTERIAWKSRDGGRRDYNLTIKEGFPSASKGMWRNLRRLGSFSADTVKERGEGAIISEMAKQWDISPLSLVLNPAPREFLIEAKAQDGGVAGDIDLEGEATARGLNPENAVVVSTLEEFKQAIGPILTEGQDVNKLGPKIWDRMQQEPNGVSHPRKEGFEGFYDTILPKEIGKYVKQWGGEVRLGDLETGSGGEPSTPIHRVNITPAMRQGVAEGQALFSPAKRRALGTGLNDLLPTKPAPRSSPRLQVSQSPSLPPSPSPSLDTAYQQAMAGSSTAFVSVDDLQRASGLAPEAFRAAVRAGIDAGTILPEPANTAAEAARFTHAVPMANGQTAVRVVVTPGSPSPSLPLSKSLSPPVSPSSNALDTAAAAADPAPSDAQKEAGNYKKGHVRIAGMDISVENAAGTQRQGTDANGKAWSITMRDHYGYIRGTKGSDGDHVDVFFPEGLDPAAPLTEVHLVRQNDPRTGRFDEYKVMLGYPSTDAARSAYLRNYEPGWKGLGAIGPMKIERFKDLATSGAFEKAKTGDAALASAAKRGQTNPMAADSGAAQSKFIPSPSGLSGVEEVKDWLESLNSKNPTYRTINGKRVDYWPRHLLPPGSDGIAAVWISSVNKSAISDSTYFTINVEPKAGLSQQWAESGKFDEIENQQGAYADYPDFDDPDKWTPGGTVSFDVRISDHAPTDSARSTPYQSVIITGDSGPTITRMGRIYGSLKAKTWGEGVQALLDSIASDLGFSSLVDWTQQTPTVSSEGSGPVGPTDRSQRADQNLPDSPPSPAQVNPESRRAGDGAALSSPAKRRLTPGTAADALGRGLKRGGAAVADAGLRAGTAVVEGSKVGPVARVWSRNELDKALHDRLTSKLWDRVDNARDAAKAWLQKPDANAFQRIAKSSVDQLLPNALVPREWLALYHESQRKSAWGREQGMDVMRSLTNEAKISDLGYPAAYADAKWRMRLFEAMEAESSNPALMQSLPKELQEVAAKLRTLLRGVGRELVKQRLMSLDTFEELSEAGWMPRFTLEDANAQSGSWLAKLKLAVKDMSPQRSTAWHVVDTSRKETDGQYAIISYDDTESGRRNRWRFRSEQHRDAFYEDFIRREALELLQQGAQGKAGAKEVTTMLAPLTDADKRLVRAEIQMLTRDKMDKPAMLSQALRGIIERAKTLQRVRYKKQAPFEPEALIKDPIYAVARYVAAQTHNAATMELFRATAANPEWAVKSKSGIKGYTKMPDSDRLGPLAGMHVRDDIGKQLSELVNMPNAALQFYDSLLRAWKSGKLVLNPASHMRDAVGNAVFSGLAGSSIWNPGNLKWYRDSLSTLRNGGDLYAELVEMQVLGGDAYSSLVRSHLQGLIPDQAAVEKIDAQGMVAMMTGFGSRLLKDLMGRGRAAYDTAAALRRFPDDFYKTAAYLKYKSEGMTPQEAAAEVRKWFPYYDRLGKSKFWSGTSRVINPFSSFFRESTRILGLAARERPLALSAQLSLPFLITMYSIAMMRMGDDDREAVLEGMRGKLKFGPKNLPLFSMVLPWRSSGGQLQQWDLASTMPFADLIGTRVEFNDNEDAFRRFWRGLATGSPFSTLAVGYMTDTIPFSGQRFIHDDMTLGERITERVKFAATTLLPPTTPYVGTSAIMMENAGRRQANKSMAMRSPGQALARYFGFDIRNADPSPYDAAEKYREENNLPRAHTSSVFDLPLASRLKKIITEELVQDEPNIDAIVEAMQRLDQAGVKIKSPKDMIDLLDSMDPRFIIPKAHRARFAANLSPEQKRVIAMAQAEFDKAKRRAGSAWQQARTQLQSTSE